jgi:hypothetical protein
MMLRSVTDLLTRCAAAALAVAVLLAWQVAPLADLGRHHASAPSHQPGDGGAHHWCEGTDVHGGAGCVLGLAESARDASHRFPAPPVLHLGDHLAVVGYSPVSSPRAIARHGRVLPRAPPSIG